MGSKNKQLSREPRVLLYDIEASNLAANFGYIFCIGYKFVGEKNVTLMSIRDYKGFKKNTTNDKELVKDFSKVLESSDVQVAHYGRRFDLPFIRTRLMMHGLPPIKDVPLIDTWRIARDMFKFNSNRLDTISRAVFESEEKDREFKTPIDSQHWVRGAAGHVPSIKYIEEHCIADIKVLEKVYLQLRGHAINLPNLSKVVNLAKEGCPACGSDNIVANGQRLTQRGMQQRAKCNDCAHNFQVPIKAFK